MLHRFCSSSSSNVKVPALVPSSLLLTIHSSFLASKAMTTTPSCSTSHNPPPLPLPPLLLCCTWRVCSSVKIPHLLPSFPQRRRCARSMRRPAASHCCGVRLNPFFFLFLLFQFAPSHSVLCSDADAVCQHISALSATAPHTVANPLALVQQLLQATSASG